jgi:hypothetical protein
MGWTIGGSSLGRGWEFYSLPPRPDRLWVPRIKRPGREADQSPPPSADVKNAWSYTSTPPIRLHGVVLFTHAKRQAHCNINYEQHILPWNSWHSVWTRSRVHFQIRLSFLSKERFGRNMEIILTWNIPSAGPSDHTVQGAYGLGPLEH